MSEKSEKKLRRVIRKNYRLQYKEFLRLTETLEWTERFRIAWVVLWKLGTTKEQKRRKYETKPIGK